MASGFTAFPCFPKFQGNFEQAPWRGDRGLHSLITWIRRFCQLLRKDFPVVFCRTSADVRRRFLWHGSVTEAGWQVKISFLQKPCTFCIFSQMLFIHFPSFSEIFKGSFFFDSYIFTYIFTTCHHCNIMLSSCSPIFWSGLAKCPLFCAGFWAGVGWWIGMQSHLLRMFGFKFGLIWILQVLIGFAITILIISVGMA